MSHVKLIFNEFSIGSVHFSSQSRFPNPYPYLPMDWLIKLFVNHQFTYLNPFPCQKTVWAIEANMQLQY